jgi:3-hydroxypropanoate dehydrogenase
MGHRLDGEALDQLFRTARTANHYTDEPVGETDLHASWDLMRMGPTSANQLPARLVWCTSQAAKDTLADCASGANADKIRKAPVSVVIGMDMMFHEYLPEFFPHADAKSWFDGNAELRHASAFRNSSLQAGYLILAVRALGLDCGPMSGFDADKVDHAFFADQPSVRTNLISTLGHGDFSATHDRLPRPAFERFNRIA